MPTISVVIPVRNAGSMLRRTLESVQAQRYPALEVLVLDGGSTDETNDVIAEFSSLITWSRSHPDNSAVEAISEGMAHVRGDIVALLSADDWLENGALICVGTMFQHQPDLDVITGGVLIVEEREGEVRVIEKIDDRSSLDLKLDKVLARPLTHARFIRTDKYRELGGYDQTLSESADLDFLIRLVRNNPAAATTTRIVYTFRQHPHSATLGSDRVRLAKVHSENLLIFEKHMASMLSTHEHGILRGFHSRHGLRLIGYHVKKGELLAALSVFLRVWLWNGNWHMQVAAWVVQSLCIETFRRP